MSDTPDLRRPEDLASDRGLFGFGSDPRRSFFALAETIKDPVAVWSCLRSDSGEIVDFVYEYVNATAVDRIGLPAELLLGRRLLEVLPAHLDTGLFDRYREVARSGHADVVEVPWFADGNLVGAFETSVSPLGDGVVCVSRDMTDRVVAEHRLRSSEARFRMVFDAANDAVFRTVAGVVEWVSPAVERVLGYSPSSLRGVPISVLCHDDDQGLLGASTAPESDETVTGRRRGRLRCADGSWRTVESHVRRVDPNEALLGISHRVAYVATVRDVEAEERAWMTAERLRRELEAMRSRVDVAS